MSHVPGRQCWKLSGGSVVAMKKAVLRYPQSKLSLLKVLSYARLQINTCTKVNVKVHIILCFLLYTHELL